MENKTKRNVEAEVYDIMLFHELIYSEMKELGIECLASPTMFVMILSKKESYQRFEIPFTIDQVLGSQPVKVHLEKHMQEHFIEPYIDTVYARYHTLFGNPDMEVQDTFQIRFLTDPF